MFGSIRVATIRGIPIRLHITLLAMFAVLVLRFGALGVPAGVVLFASVLVHELGHSIVAQRHGIRIASIDLHLLGGMAMMTQPPSQPRHEIAIAAAGPLVSLTIGAIAMGLATLTGASFGNFSNPAWLDLIGYAAVVNLAMGIFNLFPALPMDGGRIFRAALSLKLGQLRATRAAATVSRLSAVLFIAGGMFVGWQLVLVGVLLLVMVGHEERVAEAQEIIRQRRDEPFAPAVDLPRETREVFVDLHGRRYLIVTRVV
jgi:Zn-dependent protease